MNISASISSYRHLALVLSLALATVFVEPLRAEPSDGASAQLVPSDLDALKVIASRKGLTRLDYSQETQKWSLFDSSLMTTFIHFIKSKSRYDVISPIEDLVQRLEGSYLSAANNDPAVFNLIRRAYASLSSLYSYYKINPDSNKERQYAFIGRFGVVLTRLKTIITDIENKTPLAKRYRPMPWFGEMGANVKSNDKEIGLNYLNMSERGLLELNQSLAQIGNNDTKIDRAMEFYPKERTTLFRSASSNTSTKKLAIFIVHGTYAAGSPEYISDEHILFQQTKYMAQTLANDQNVPVAVYAFGWSGANDNEVRMDAGEELANFVRTYFPPEEYNDIYIGHSHGGNVIMHFAKTLREYRTPYMVITLATPIRKDFITDNFNYLFEFYTQSDWVQYYGSYEMTLRNSTSTGQHAQNPRMVLREDIEKLGLFAHNDRYNRVKIYAVRVLLNNVDLSGPLQSHTNIKYLIGSLPKVLDTLMKYKPNNHFGLNVDIDENAKLTVDQMEDLHYQIVPIGLPN